MDKQSRWINCFDTNNESFVFSVVQWTKTTSETLIVAISLIKSSSVRGLTNIRIYIHKHVGKNICMHVYKYTYVHVYISGCGQTHTDTHRHTCRVVCLVVVRLFRHHSIGRLILTC